mmetsp:Transcript_12259/g.36422  ORF Transcript_12259/g.36422 Transcript_12259/m.36422 type:complete len:200 (-) Transcript_12259:266-865(-)
MPHLSVDLHRGARHLEVLQEALHDTDTLLHPLLLRHLPVLLVVALGHVGEVHLHLQSADLGHVLRAPEKPVENRPLGALRVDLHIGGQGGPAAKMVRQGHVLPPADHLLLWAQAEAVGLVGRLVAVGGDALARRAVGRRPCHRRRLAMRDEAVVEPGAEAEDVAHLLAPHVALLDAIGERQGVPLLHHPHAPDGVPEEL